MDSDGSRRILVTGNAGSGKTTLAQALAAALGLPYRGLDAIVWGPGWVKAAPAICDARVRDLAAAPTWVADGVSPLLLEAADMVVFLDRPRRVCYHRAVKRNLRYLFTSRPGLPPRCPELLVVPRLLRMIWRFPTRVRPQILARRHALGARFIHVRSDNDVQHLMALVVGRR